MKIKLREESRPLAMMSARMLRSLDYVTECAHQIYQSQNKCSNQGPLAAQEQECGEKGKYSR